MLVDKLADISGGNIIEYWGPSGHQYVTVNNIEVLGDGRKMYSLKTLYEPDKVFNGYKEQISPVFFREHHLKQLGFSFDEDLRLYTLNGLTLGAFSYIEGPDWFNLTAGFTNYHVLPTGFPISPTKEQLKEQGIEIPFLHVFQNFCADKGIKIDFSSIKY